MPALADLNQIPHRLCPISKIFILSLKSEKDLICSSQPLSNIFTLPNLASAYMSNLMILLLAWQLYFQLPWTLDFLLPLPLFACSASSFSPSDVLFSGVKCDFSTTSVDNYYNRDITHSIFILLARHPELSTWEAKEKSYHVLRHQFFKWTFENGTK